MGAPYVELLFELGTLAAQDAEAACEACGALAVTFTAADAEAVLEPAPGEFRLWSQTRVHALFGSDAVAAHASAQLARTLARALKLPVTNFQSA